MQKIINGIALLSGVVSLAVVGSGGYLYLNKDAIIEDIKGKVMESVMPSIGCLLYTSPSPRDLDLSRMTSSA